MSLRHTFEGFDGATNSKLVAQNTALMLALGLALWMALAPALGFSPQALAFIPDAIEYLMWVALGSAGVFQWESRAHTRGNSPAEEVTP